MLNDIITQEAKDTAQSCIICLHGLGASAHDFTHITEIFNFPSTRYIFPNAPIRPVTLNLGIPAPAWYDVLGVDRNATQDREGIEASSQWITHLIEQEIEQGVPAHKIVLAGFSQGAAMALHVGVRFREPLGAIVALSGYLPLGDVLAIEKNALNHAVPLFIAHGDFDTVLPLSFAELSVATLEQQGFKPIFNRYPIAHTVSDQEMMDVRDFLMHIVY